MIGCKKEINNSRTVFKIAMKRIVFLIGLVILTIFWIRMKMPVSILSLALFALGVITGVKRKYFFKEYHGAEQVLLLIACELYFFTLMIGSFNDTDLYPIIYIDILLMVGSFLVLIMIKYFIKTSLKAYEKNTPNALSIIYLLFNLAVLVLIVLEKQLFT